MAFVLTPGCCLFPIGWSLNSLLWLASCLKIATKKIKELRERVCCSSLGYTWMDVAYVNRKFYKMREFTN